MLRDFLRIYLQVSGVVGIGLMFYFFDKYYKLQEQMDSNKFKIKKVKGGLNYANHDSK